MTTDKLPTEAMLKAGKSAYRKHNARGMMWEHELRDIYLAMEAVRPPVGEEVVRETLLNIEGVEEETQLVKSRLREHLQSNG
jgi:hypothetical protein